MKMMKKCTIMLLVVVILASIVIPAAAETGRVYYTGQSQKFIFYPGTKESPTNLFPDFQNVMPGDKLTQTIEIHNKLSNLYNIKVYLRSKGATNDPVDLLSQLKLTVTLLGTNAKILYQGPADEAGTLKDWVHLGTLSSGGKAQLALTLEVPITLGNDYAEKAAQLQWEFKVEEIPITLTPQTGDGFQMGLWLALLTGSAVVLVILIIVKRKKKNQ